MEFSGKELIKGEPDASSFPSGGLRATAEARGYTAWDPTSYAFVKDDTLCIPHCVLLLHRRGHWTRRPRCCARCRPSPTRPARCCICSARTCPRVATVGPEQEYFLIKKEDYDKRLDLVLTGRTPVRLCPVQGPGAGGHYFGTIRPIVSEFMKDLDQELWKLGVPAKTKHNEVAPCQHELAPI